MELAADPAIRRSLQRRNDGLATFWLAGADRPAPRPTGLRATIIDAEDTFTAMLAHQLRALGLAVTVNRFDEPLDLDAADLVVLGPGPGDPRRDDDPKMLRLAGLAERLLRDGKPLLALCLGHQVVALRLGLPVRPLPRPRQGLQRRIEVFGQTVRVGFYNSFAAYGDGDEFATWDRLVGFKAGPGAVNGSKGAAAAKVMVLEDRVAAGDLVAAGSGHDIADVADVAETAETGEAGGMPAAGSPATLGVSRDPSTGEIYALRRPGLWTCQFHPESVLSPDGLHILDEALAWVHTGHRRVFGGVSPS